VGFYKIMHNFTHGLLQGYAHNSTTLCDSFTFTDGPEYHTSTSTMVRGMYAKVLGHPYIFKDGPRQDYINLAKVSGHSKHTHK